MLATEVTLVILVLGFLIVLGCLFFLSRKTGLIPEVHDDVKELKDAFQKLTDFIRDEIQKEADTSKK